MDPILKIRYVLLLQGNTDATPNFVPLSSIVLPRIAVFVHNTFQRLELLLASEEAFRYRREWTGRPLDCAREGILAVENVVHIVQNRAERLQSV